MWTFGNPSMKIAGVSRRVNPVMIREGGDSLLPVFPVTAATALRPSVEADGA
jgi:hypothetical protein